MKTSGIVFPWTRLIRNSEIPKFLTQRAMCFSTPNEICSALPCRYCGYSAFNFKLFLKVITKTEIKLQQQLECEKLKRVMKLTY